MNIKYKLNYIETNNNPLIVSQEDREIYLFLIDFITKYPCAYSKMLQKRKELKRYLDWIAIKTPKLDDPFFKISTKLNWIFNGIDEFPECKECNHIFNDINIKINYKYPRFCSISCVANNKEINNKKRETCEKKYGKGITNPSQAQCIKDKKTQTSLKHYGVTNPNKVPEVRRKIEQTCIESYGAKSPFESKQIQEKIAQTNLKNLGVANPFELKSVSIKGLQGRLKKYGSVGGKMKCYSYDGITFDSSWELAVWIYHKDNHIQIERQPIQLHYEMDDSMHIYLPDFRINGQLVEVKGDHLFDEFGNPIFDHKHSWKEKYQCMIDNKVIIWRYKDVQPFLEYVSQKYGKDYLKSFRVNKSQNT